ncbi:hypothetical protein CIK96_12150 [Prevotella sp. P4-98]|uniref:EpsG family protein n=1 Tax=Prevotella sp. P4-98 TaxID=2024219 RepID=UPI000B963E59|nr:EpsG family protein [Prevotella sp. P4-98]OYP44142.1 hypothetical protein CIK96_12150 [Prevotella sp. P4-98]
MLIEFYKSVFLKNNHTIYWGGESHYRSWDDSTMYIYFFIVIMTFFAAYKCEQHKNKCYKQAYSSHVVSIKTCVWYRFEFLLLLCVMGLRGTWVGIDTIVYSQTFLSATSLSEIFNDGSTTEPLYKFIQFFMRCLFSDQHLAIFVYSAVILYFIKNTIWKYYDSINLMITIPAFVCIYYFQSFNIMRITLAASFILFSFPLLLNEQYKKFTVRVFVASMFHYSSVIVFGVIGMVLLYKRSKILAYVTTLIILVIVDFSVGLLYDYISIINRYTSYLESNDSSNKIGLALFVDYLPCLYICYYIITRKIKGHWADLTISFTMCAIVCRMLAYYISLAGRLGTHFMPLILILMPYWINYIKQKNQHHYKIMVICCSIWAFLRIHIYFVGYLSLDGIMPYYFYWNER